jgi:hypothetical protein
MTRNDFDNSGRQFDRQFGRAAKLAAGWFIFCGLVALAVLGLLGWAVVVLVRHFAG